MVQLARNTGIEKSLDSGSERWAWRMQCRSRETVCENSPGVLW